MKRTAMIFVASLAALIGILLWPRVGFRTEQRKFTPAAWATATVEERDWYSAHLAETGCLLGLREDQVVEMLGRPDQVDERIVYHFETANRRFPRSPAALVVNLNSRGTVTRVTASGFPDGSSAIPFHADGWHMGSDDVRAAMALDITRTGLLDGETRTEVIRLLGNPTRTTLRRLAYYGRRYHDNDQQAIRRSGKKLFVMLSEGKVTSVAYTGS